MAEKNKKFTFHTVPASKKANWDWNEKESAEFVKNGDQNDFPQQLIDMYNRSSVHASCINAIVEGVIRTRIEVHNIDYSLVRAKEKDERGHIPGYYVSTKFGHMNYKKLNPDDYSYLPVFDPEKEDEYAQIFVHRNYRPGQLYYSLPDYVGSITSTLQILIQD